MVLSSLGDAVKEHSSINLEKVLDNHDLVDVVGKLKDVLIDFSTAIVTETSSTPTSVVPSTTTTNDGSEETTIGDGHDSLASEGDSGSDGTTPSSRVTRTRRRPVVLPSRNVRQRSH